MQRWLTDHAQHRIDLMPEYAGDCRDIVCVNFALAVSVDEHDRPFNMLITYEYCFDDGWTSRYNSITCKLELDQLGMQLAKSLIKLVQSGIYRDSYVSGHSPIATYSIMGECHADIYEREGLIMPHTFKIEKKTLEN